MSSHFLFPMYAYPSQRQKNKPNCPPIKHITSSNKVKEPFVNLALQLNSKHDLQGLKSNSFPFYVQNPACSRRNL